MFVRGCAETIAPVPRAIRAETHDKRQEVTDRLHDAGIGLHLALLVAMDFWRRPTILFVAILLSAISRYASAGDSSYVPHVRSVDRDLASLILDGVRLSPAFRSLVDQLDRSRLIVHVEYRLLPSSVWARTMLVASRRGWRYVRIQIDYRLAALDRLMMIGHELQHAVEIAESPTAVDPRSVEELYRRIGFPTDLDGRTFETLAARERGNTIRREVLSFMSAREGQEGQWSATARR
jgi:hypothetical protein